MNNLGRTLIVTALLFISWRVFGEAPNPLESLRRQMIGKKKLSGRFLQTRYIQSMDLLLKSEGQFQILKHRALQWEQQKPFPSHFLLSENSATLKLKDRPAQNIDILRNPQMSVVRKVFQSLLFGEASDIATYFRQRPSGSPSAWNIELEPKNKKLKKVILKIEVSGHQHIQNLRIVEVNGGFTQIQFRDVKAR